NIEIIESFMQKVGYQGVVDKKKDVIQYPRFTKLIIIDLMNRFLTIPQRLDEDYHSIKNIIILVSFYSTGNVLFHGMLILNEFLTVEIRATNDYKEYEMVFVGENPKVDDDDDDDVNVIEKMDDEKKHDNVEKTDDVAEKDNDDHIDHALVEPRATGSIDTRNEQIQTPIPIPIRSPRSALSSNKIVSQELIATASPTLAITSKAKHKKGFTLYKVKKLPGSTVGMSKRRGLIITHLRSTFVTNEFFMKKKRETLDKINDLALEITVVKTNKKFKEAIPRLIDQAVIRDKEINSTNVA
nr:hypothetical protein [Tanacetum cinerariifolium]